MECAPHRSAGSWKLESSTPDRAAAPTQTLISGSSDRHRHPLTVVGGTFSRAPAETTQLFILALLTVRLTAVVRRIGDELVRSEFDLLAMLAFSQ